MKMTDMKIKDMKLQDIQLQKHERSLKEANVSSSWINWVDVDLALRLCSLLLLRFEECPRTKFSRRN